MLRNTPAHYGWMAKALHWLIAPIVIAMLALGFYAHDFAPKALKSNLFFVHKSLGLCLLALMLGRLIWRWMNTSPGYPDTIPLWQRLAARGVHWGFYVAIIATLVIGWVMSSMGTYGVSFWGWFDATLPLAKSKSTQHLLHSWHTILAWVIIALIALHLLAALKHAFINRDGIFQRMWF